jgi:hypothetical protein
MSFLYYLWLAALWMLETRAAPGDGCMPSPETSEFG